MPPTACLLFDVVALAAGVLMAWRRRWRGVAGEALWLGAFAAAAIVAATLLLRPLGGFAVMRGWTHALFCVLLPVLALRALRVRRQAPRTAALLLGAALLGEACYLWARHVEPYRLEVTTATVTSPRLASLPRPLRVACVADLQTDAITGWEVTVFDHLVAAAPDVVLFLGDYLQLTGAAFARELPALHAQLRRLDPPLGMFAVDGDVDVGGARAVFDGTAVQVLVDGHAMLPGVPIELIGLSRMRSRAPFLDRSAVSRLAGDRFPIVFGHAPDFMLAVLRGGLAADALFVAGHTHGGQIQVPGLGPPLILSAVPRWLGAGGVFRHGDAWLACSRGLGMERDHAPRLRFWCRPQLLLLDLGGR